LNILKNLKKRLRKRLPEALFTRSNVKIVTVYVGQSSHVLKTRMKEHAKAIATLDKNSLLAKHHMLNGHQIDLRTLKLSTDHQYGNKD